MSSPQPAARRDFPNAPGLLDGPPPSARILAGYGLDPGQAVEVELLIGAGTTGRLLEGHVTGATPDVLILDPKGHHRPTRVPWAAIALIRDALADHPGA